LGKVKRFPYSTQAMRKDFFVEDTLVSETSFFNEHSPKNSIKTVFKLDETQSKLIIVQQELQATGHWQVLNIWFWNRKN
jgi:hypothetical protein